MPGTRETSARREADPSDRRGFGDELAWPLHVMKLSAESAYKALYAAKAAGRNSVCLSLE